VYLKTKYLDLLLMHCLTLNFQKGAAIPQKLLSMALNCAGMILHPGSGVVYLTGDSFNPRLVVGQRGVNTCFL
jgi:hypothetical protein